MSERKVLNKYYPPDFDPSKIPRRKQKRDGKFGIRLMAPFNMRCNTCGEYIYKGKKFNSRKENAEGENYLGLHIFRFYIKCPRCVAEIAFKTDPESTDYTLEAGATRNFEAQRTAERLARQEMDEKEADEKNNPMKLLENRTKASLQEMDMIETLEELRELRQKHSTVNLEEMIESSVEEQRKRAVQQKEREEQEDEQFIKSVFGQDGTRLVKRLDSDDEADDEVADDDDDNSSELKRKHHEPSSSCSSSSSGNPVNKKMKLTGNPTDILLEGIGSSSSSSKHQTKFTEPSKISSAGNPSSKSSCSSSTSSLRQQLLGGVVVRAKGKEAIPKQLPSLPVKSSGDQSCQGVGGAESGKPPAEANKVLGGLACLASYSDSDDSDT